MKKILFATLMTAAVSWGATISYSVVLPTSSLTVSDGYLEMQFNPAMLPAPAGAAVAWNFVTSNLTLDFAGASTVGDVTVDAAKPSASFDNQSFFNDLLIPFTAGSGSSLAFIVTLSGDIFNPPADNTNGTTFWVYLFGSDLITPLLTPDGVQATFSVAADGTAVPAAFGDATVNEVPEPGTFLLGLAGGVALWVTRRRRV